MLLNIHRTQTEQSMELAYWQFVQGREIGRGNPVTRWLFFEDDALPHGAKSFLYSAIGCIDVGGRWGDYGARCLSRVAIYRVALDSK